MRIFGSLYPKALSIAFSFYWWLLDSRRDPDHKLYTTWTIEETKRAIANGASWVSPRRFGLIGEGNAFAIGSFFEIAPVRTAYASWIQRALQRPSTRNYPTSFGIEGRVDSAREGGTWVLVSYRLTNTRALFLGGLTSALCTAIGAGIAFPLMGIRIPLAARPFHFIVVALALLPAAMKTVVAFSRRAYPRGEVEEVTRYLSTLIGSSPPAA